ncbi:LacI family DNA-binding transcriptional regulator [Nonomuraea sp. NPDC005983]|uniref:LacI family DNA-binding transcriptional regulator n=1 Tax=Nonomuraea sp. NPDC005983 TaxID=3155595 RepID=UPI0033AA41D5
MRRSRGVTIEDVARAAGVSRQTVSNVFNAPYRLKPETLQRVSALIEEMGYRPDQSARSLKSGTKRIIAYLTPAADDPANPNPVMSGFLEAMVTVSGEAGYKVLLVRPRPDQSREQAMDEVIASRTVDGFVLADVLHNDGRVAHLSDVGFPFVGFGRTAPGEPQTWVDVDTVQAMIDLVGLLASKGHRRVAFLGLESERPWVGHRHEGFQAGVRRFGLDTSPALEVVSPARDPDSVTETLRPLLTARARPSAVVAAGDWLAMGAYAAARAEGLSVGSDLAISGFNDLPVTAFLQPALTTVRHPLPEIANALVTRLLQVIGGGQPPPAGLLLPGTLVVRDSTG